MREQARVVEVADGKVTVEVQRSTTCENCGKCTVGQKNLVVKAKVETDRPVSVGDIVTVEMQTPNLYKATVIMYGIPILMFFIGVALGYFLLAPAFSLDANILGALTGFLLLAVAYWGIRRFELKGAFDKDFKMTIVDD
jgi:sigma-E factor negative regulatory protein RseC